MALFLELLPVIGRFLFQVLAAAGIGAFTWQMFATHESDVTGPSANPTPAQKIGNALGGASQGASDAVQGVGKAANNGLVFMGLAAAGLLLLVGGRR